MIKGQVVGICTPHGRKSSFAVTPSYLRSRGFGPITKPTYAGDLTVYLFRHTCLKDYNICPQ